MVIAIVAAVVVSAVLAPVVYGAASSPQGTVAVIEVDGTITGSVANDVRDNLETARSESSIKAVVLDIDSPGGSAAASEELYIAVERTAQDMPVMASIGGIGASGAYYTAAPAESIYVTPASIVGSVGVVGPAPQPSGPRPDTTGPAKRGQHPVDTEQTLAAIQTAFVDSVMEQREDQLAVNRSVVEQANTYAGVKAVENGFADELGTTDDAVHAAATKAGLSRYDTQRFEFSRGLAGLLLAETENGTVVVVEESMQEYAGVDTPQYYMIHGEIQDEQEVIGAVDPESVTTEEDS